jgi:methylated-DNA-[protein]-cysteine S-methyltransferase
MSSCVTTVPSPLGDLVLCGDGEALTAVCLPTHTHRPAVDPAAVDDAGPFREAIAQLEAYFAGEGTAFDLPLAPRGTPFQLEVWAALRTIPHGTTTSYGALAEQIGRPKAVRAVGLANGRNPLPIIVPCHRVVGADGSLTGYGGGLEAKRLLLDLESRPARLPL